MTPNEKLLWSRLENFRFDETHASLTFSRRLARENGWEINYALRVIEEYRKFLFLCCISPVPLTPSDPVDQAWHLHLTYTKSYWIELCTNTLGREIHHNPTRGGMDERKKFANSYTALQEIYREIFAGDPPPDIWHDNKTRFSNINFRRVNLGKYWLVRKPSLRAKIFYAHLIVAAAGALFIQAFQGGIFIIIFITLSVIAAIYNNRKGGNGGGGNGCISGGSCSNDNHSGCSADSGCSGCGGCGGD